MLDNHKLTEEYVDREELLKEAFSRSQHSGASSSPLLLDCLLSLMKKKSRTKRFLSSIYFAGAQGDHPYFLKNERIAVGIAVLPEDAKKAGLSKRHPNQREVIFVVDGALCLEVEDAGKTTSKVLEEGDIFVIEKGHCHRITPVGDRDGAYLFVKTNPNEEPRAEDCNL